MSVPSVYAYLDFRAFLKDWFDDRKRTDPDYSYAAFAEAGGCSKAALANVIGGTRTPRAESLDAFARAMTLRPPERTYLGLLVELATAEDLSTRRDVMEKILASERYQRMRLAENHSGEDASRYLEHWYIPVIREMGGLPGFHDDPAWIASRLTPPIRPEQASAALETLFELGFLARGEDGRVRQREIRFRTEPETVQGAAAHFHRVVIPTLLGTVDATRGNTQHLLAATVALDPSMLPEAKARLNAALEHLVTMADAAVEPDGRRVYQVAIQLLPVTDALS